MQQLTVNILTNTKWLHALSWTSLYVLGGMQQLTVNILTNTKRLHFLGLA